VNTPYQGAPATRFSVAVLALVLVASVIMPGCGGGEQQKNRSQGSKDHSQGSKAQTTNQESTTKQAANRESLSGTVVDTLPDRDKVIISPNWKGQKNAKVVKVKYRPDNVEVTLQGEQANPDAINVGQQATVSYVKTTKDSREVNVARSIWLQPGSGATQGNETTG
jgi:hypothetical protein